MTNKNIPDIYNYLQEIAWHFGNHGINGECCGDLSLVEFMALKKASEDKDLSIQEIGSTLNFTKSGATRIIDRLENKGYVTREHSLLDGRVCCVAATAKGKEVTTNISEKYTVYLDEMLKDLEPQMFENIKDVLEILVKAVRQKAFIYSKQTI
ncbi:MAG: MarR family transcriptional regulator [Desulfosporosinus sp.]